MLFFKSVASGFEKVTQLTTAEDVATVLDVYAEMLKQGVKPEEIVYPYENNGKYVFLVGSSLAGAGEFDLFPWIKEMLGDTELVVTCTNAKFLFGKNRSRGYYQPPVNPVNTVSKPNYDEEEVGTTDMDEDEDGESQTGFLDEDDEEGSKHYLLHVILNRKIPISIKRGLIIGRSSQRTDYAVSNGNVGRVHAQVYVDDSGRYMVHDCDSKNGTYINGLRIPKGGDRELTSDCQLTLADEEFKFV